MPKYAAPTPPMVPARWSGGAQTPKAVVIHGTVSPCVKGGARAVAHFFATEDNKTSAHYVVDPGEIVQCVGDHAIAYHCGYNTNSIGVELCDPQTGPGGRWTDDAHAQMLARAALLVAQLCLAYGIEPVRPTSADLASHGPHGIYGHNDSRLAFGNTSHSDPGADFPWPTFLAAVRQEIATIRNGGTVPARPAAPTNLSRLRDRYVKERVVDLALLDAAAKNGRLGTRAAAAAIRVIVNRLPIR